MYFSILRNKIIPYNPKLKDLARKLRKQSTLSEILLWKQVRAKSFGVEIHRQVPIDKFIVDFYCHELMLVIEVDGDSHDRKGALERDTIRQQRLESFGVEFIRFHDLEVKKDMQNVIRALEGKIEELLKKRNT